MLYDAMSAGPTNEGGYQPTFSRFYQGRPARRKKRPPVELIATVVLAAVVAIVVLATLANDGGQVDGPPVNASQSTSGVVAAAKAAIEENTGDPSSIEWIRVEKVAKVYANGKEATGVRIKFRSLNNVGALAVQTVDVVVLPNGKAVVPGPHDVLYYP